MSDELIEALAKRLWDAATADGDFQAFPFEEMNAAHPEMTAGYYRQAAEALRQMQWARHQALEHVAGARDDAPRWAYETHLAIKDADLTLAPPSWTPKSPK